MSFAWKPLLDACDPSLCPQTRIHPLPSFAQTEYTCNIYLKREDETGFGISGNKQRKYASLIPFLREQEFQEVGVIGGAHSNHVSGMLQLLNEHRIRAHLFLKESHNDHRGGNRFLIELLSTPDQIQWIAHEDWPRVVSIARDYFERKETAGYVIPEGGSCGPAWAGACTLMHDIIRNEEEHGFSFDQIFIDAGTGFMASSLVWMNAILQRSSHIHVVLVAGNEESFRRQLIRTQPYFPIPIHNLLPESLPEYTVHFPTTAKAFGSVNQTLRQAIKRYAQTEGVLTDPIYSAKLLYTAEHFLQKHTRLGNVLLIHSGGGTGLMGFSEQFFPL